MPTIHHDLCTRCGAWAMPSDDLAGWLYVEDDEGNLLERICPRHGREPRTFRVVEDREPRHREPRTLRVVYRDDA